MAPKIKKSGTEGEIIEFIKANGGMIVLPRMFNLEVIQGEMYSLYTACTLIGVCPSGCDEFEYKLRVNGEQITTRI